jgi:hypothetical protein
MWVVKKRRYAMSVLRSIVVVWWVVWLGWNGRGGE